MGVVQFSGEIGLHFRDGSKLVDTFVTEGLHCPSPPLVPPLPLALRPGERGDQPIRIKRSESRTSEPV